ncbi:MAG: RNA polymerase sigma factor [Deltaproteobacteria bacterium]|nr:RNA polymerase sigma factor [Deltaproteobacteria bacterium]
MRRLRRGDEGAFAEAFEHYRPRIFPFLLRYCRSRSIAEELTQETFLRLAKSAKGLRADTRLGVWLFVVARNLGVSYLRRAFLHQDRLTALIGLEAPVPRRPETPFEVIAAADATGRLAAAVASLPPIYREVVLLLGVEELSALEVAEVLSLSVEAVRQRWSRGRRLLQAILEDEAPPAGGRHE